MLNPTLLFVVVEHCWLYCMLFVVGRIDDKSNVIVGCIVCSLLLVVLMINQMLLLIVCCWLY